MPSSNVAASSTASTYERTRSALNSSNTDRNSSSLDSQFDWTAPFVYPASRLISSSDAPWNPR